MKFVVIEGLDGSGKSTQVNLLQKYLREHNIPFEYLHFPRTEAPYYGEMVARFLRGDFGDINDVDPYLVALLYAGDRKDAAELIEKWKLEGKLVLIDRYVLSNIAFQCAKMKNKADRDKLADWIFSFEYEHNKIPKPDISIFLKVPFEFTRQKLTSDRSGDDRDYLDGKTDIHEADLDFQQAVREVYLSQIEKQKTFHLIDCASEDGQIKAPEDIFASIIGCLKENRVF